MYLGHRALYLSLVQHKYLTCTRSFIITTTPSNAPTATPATMLGYLIHNAWRLGLRSLQAVANNRILRTIYDTILRYAASAVRLWDRYRQPVINTVFTNASILDDLPEEIADMILGEE